jgi:hypothetical protein
VLLVVLVEELTRRRDHLEVDDLVALGLDATEDLSGELAGDAVGLDEDEGLFEIGHAVLLWFGGGQSSA